MGETGVDVVALVPAGRRRKLERPVDFLVVDQRHIGLDAGAAHRCQRLKLGSQRGDFAKDARVRPPVVVDHRAMELLHAATAVAPLEILNRVRTVRDRLQRLQPKHAGTLLTLPLPRSGIALHHQKRTPLEPALDVMAEGDLQGARAVLGVRMVVGIVVPRDDVHMRRELRPVDLPAHRLMDVCGERDSRREPAQHLGLVQVAGQALVGDEAVPVEAERELAPFAIRPGPGRDHLVPIAVRMAPDARVPGAVQRLEGRVLRAQPFPEGGLAQRAVAVAVVFIGDVPEFQRGMASVARRELFRHGRAGAPVDGRGQTVVDADAVLLAHAVVRRAEDFGMLAREPRRVCGGGRGQHEADAVFMQQRHHAVQPTESVDALGRLEGGPGEDADGRGGDSRLAHQPHILRPHRLRPLLGVVVAAM